MTTIHCFLNIKSYNFQTHCNNKHSVEVFQLKEEFLISSVNEDLEIYENNCNDNLFFCKIY